MMQGIRRKPGRSGGRACATVPTPLATTAAAMKAYRGRSRPALQDPSTTARSVALRSSRASVAEAGGTTDSSAAWIRGFDRDRGGATRERWAGAGIVATRGGPERL